MRQDLGIGSRPFSVYLSMVDSLKQNLFETCLRGGKENQFGLPGAVLGGGRILGNHNWVKASLVQIVGEPLVWASVGDCVTSQSA